MSVDFEFEVGERFDSMRDDRDGEWEIIHSCTGRDDRNWYDIQSSSGMTIHVHESAVVNYPPAVSDRGISGR